MAGISEGTLLERRDGVTMPFEMRIAIGELASLGCRSLASLPQRGQTGVEDEGPGTVQAAHRRDRQGSCSRANPNDAGAVLKIQSNCLDPGVKLDPTADDPIPTPAIQPVISESSDNTF